MSDYTSFYIKDLSLGINQVDEDDNYMKMKTVSVFSKESSVPGVRSIGPSYYGNAPPCLYIDRDLPLEMLLMKINASMTSDDRIS